MADLFSWLQSPVAIWVAFHLFVLFMLAIDLFVFQRHAHAVSMKEAAGWSIVWMALAFVFAWGIWRYWHIWYPQEAGQGGTKAIEFITGYLIEKSLSVDNLFVFLVIFRYFAVPSHLQPRILLWGILGALIMRISLILLGATLLKTFHWMIYVFGLFLIYTAYRLWHSVEEEIDPGKNPILRLARRFFRIADGYDTPHFWVKRDNRWHLTTLPVVLLVIESTDVIFALDSIPAIFGITQDVFIVYTSNIFAILGLRALYFLLANLLGMFRYLSAGLALVLGFVGLKMITQDHLKPYFEQLGINEQGLIVISLGVISAILASAVVASIIAGPKEPLDHMPEGVSERTSRLLTALAVMWYKKRRRPRAGGPMNGAHPNHEHEELQQAVTKHGIGSYQRHVFLCTGPSCCTPEVGLAAWEELKKQLKEKDLLSGANACYRTKVGCLRICCHGPTMLVYPEGAWYHGMTVERIPRFVQQHLIEGKPVEEWIFARNPLANAE